MAHDALDDNAAFHLQFGELNFPSNAVNTSATCAPVAWATPAMMPLKVLMIRARDVGGYFGNVVLVADDDPRFGTKTDSQLSKNVHKVRLEVQHYGIHKVWVSQDLEEVVSADRDRHDVRLENIHRLRHLKLGHVGAGRAGHRGIGKNRVGHHIKSAPLVKHVRVALSHRNCPEACGQAITHREVAGIAVPPIGEIHP